MTTALAACRDNAISKNFASNRHSFCDTDAMFSLFLSKSAKEIPAMKGRGNGGGSGRGGGEYVTLNTINLILQWHQQYVMMTVLYS